MHAALCASNEEISTLLELGVNVHATDNKGMTALMHAAGRPAGSMLVKKLLEHGADPDATDIKGLTALDHARKISNQYWRRGTVELLESGS